VRMYCVQICLKSARGACDGRGDVHPVQPAPFLSIYFILFKEEESEE
jgi:hypothetical protein